MKRRSLPAALVVGLLAVLMGGAFLLRDGSPSSTQLLLPRRGETRPGQLPNGRPIFVVRHKDESVDVIDAFSTHRPWGIRYLVAWCPSSRTFVDPFHGSLFNEYGQYLAGPAATGLPSYRLQASSGAGHLEAGTLETPPARGKHPHPKLQGPHCVQRINSAGDASLVELVPATVSDVRLWDSPQAALATSTDDWVRVKGTLLVPRAGGPRLCQSSDGDSCVAVLGVNPPFARDRQHAPSGVWLARMTDGALVDLTFVTFAR